jgi:hypothetical protein
MNLLAKAKSLSGLILVSALFLSSCNDISDIGLEIQPGEDLINVAFTEDFIIQTQVTLHDSIRSSRTGRIMAGYLKDPKLGDVYAEGYFQIYPNVGIRVPQSGELVDMQVTLMIDSIYGNKSALQTMALHPIVNNINTETTYFTYSREAYSSDPIPSSVTQVGILGVIPVPNSSDTRARVDTAITFNVKELGEAVIAKSKAQPEWTASWSPYLQSFHGLALVSQDPNQGTGIMSVFLGSQRTTARLRYRTPRDPAPDGTIAYDTTSIAFTVSGKTPDGQDPGIAYSYVRGNRSNTDLASLVSHRNVISTAQTGNLGFAQSGTGIRTNIYIPGLDSLKARIGNAAISKAELIITPTHTEGFPVPAQISLTMLDANGNLAVGGGQEIFARNSNVTQRATPFTFPYNQAEKKYILNITEYANSVINGARPNNGVSLSVRPNNVQVSRLVFGDADNQQSTPMILRVYYIPAN